MTKTTRAVQASPAATAVHWQAARGLAWATGPLWMPRALNACGWPLGASLTLGCRRATVAALALGASRSSCQSQVQHLVASAGQWLVVAVVLHRAARRQSLTTLLRLATRTTKRLQRRTTATAWP